MGQAGRTERCTEICGDLSLDLFRLFLDLQGLELQKETVPFPSQSFCLPVNG